MVDVDRGGRDIRVSPADEGIHPIAVQPKKSLCKLPKIVSIGTNWKSTRSPRCVDSLLLQQRELSRHPPDLSYRTFPGAPYSIL